MNVHNRYYRMELDDTSGALLALNKGNKEFIRAGVNRPLFTIRFRDPGGGIHDVSSRESKAVSVSAPEGSERIEVSYSEFGELPLRVLVTIRCPEDSPFTYWRIDAEHETDWIIEWIDFPNVVVPNDLTATGGTGKLVWPFNEGVLIEDVAVRESTFAHYVEPNYPSRGIDGIYPAIVPSQFMAYYDDSGGLYFGAHDPDGHLKCVEFYPVDEGIRLQFRLYPGGGAYEMSYDMVLGVFDGDWHDAAAIYRDWYEANVRRDSVPIAENNRLPDWYADSPIVVTYPVRGRHDMDVMDPNKLFPYLEAMPHIERLAEEFGGKIMVLLMHWEGSAPWAPPYVWPPFGGEEAFRAFADQLHASGHLLGVYCSGIGWTEQSNLISSYNRKEQFDQENLADAMCLSPEGDLPYSKICTAQRRGYDLCSTHPFTIETMISETRQMIEGGVDYIQAFDQNHGGTSYFCYSRTHGHPPAPGKWQTEAMNTLFRKLRETADQVGRKVLFGCESASAEPYLPDLLFNDARFNLNYFIGTPIPLYAFLYHRYINNFMGNQVMAHEAFDHGRSPDNLLYRMAYSFHAGDMSTVVLTENGEMTWNWGVGQDVGLPEQESILKFIRNTNPWRTGAGKAYLYQGRMLKPFPLSGVGLQRFNMHDGREFAVPAVLTTRWEADDGSQAQLFVNYTREEQAFCVETGTRSGKDAVLLTHPDGSQPLTVQADESGTFSCSVKPLSAILIQF